MSSDAAEGLRLQGNDAFARHEYKKAAKIYRDALRLAPSAVLHCNRAMCFIKLQDWLRAVSDCVAGLAATPPQPLRIKLLYRLGVAHAGQHDWPAATKFLTLALELDPGNVAARAALEEATKAAAAPPPPAAAAPRYTRIPVATVEKLPERFEALLEPQPPAPAPVPAASPAAEREISEMFALTAGPSAAAPGPSASGAAATGPSASGAAATGPLSAAAAAEAAAAPASMPASMHYLASLRSVPPARKHKAYQLVVNLPPSDYREVFGPAGMDADFLPFFMEAAHQVAVADTVPDWHTKILALLAAFAAMPRYTVALVFCAQTDLSGLLEAVQRKHPALRAAYKSHLQAPL